MLYATTRSDHNTYTAQRALKEYCAPDGGLYVPMLLTPYSSEQIAKLGAKSVCETIADVMNYFFSCRLNQRDIEFSIGKTVTKLGSISHRITVAECWRNPDGDFARIQRIITERIAVDKGEIVVGEWMQVASRVAVLFAVYGQMLRHDQIDPEAKFDVAVLTGSFTGPMAAWYARKMGLPIDNIICCCNDNSAVWDLLQLGEMKTRPLVRRTATPKCDVGVPAGLERLIRESLGLREANRYVAVCKDGNAYELMPDRHDLLRKGMYAAVVSDKRIPRVIANVYATSGYVLCPYTALVYGGLMDYRAMTGNNGPALMLCETSPLQCEDAVSKAMGISVSQLHERLDIGV